MPARKAQATKAFLGTDQPCRRPKPTFQPLTEVPEPPHYLTANAVPEWERIAPQAAAVGMAAADIRALALLCETLATEHALQALIESEGVTVESGSGARKAHPALAALAQARQQAANLMTAFGLNPKARQALPAPTSGRKPWDRNQFGYNADGSNPFDQF